MILRCRTPALTIVFLIPTAEPGHGLVQLTLSVLDSEPVASANVLFRKKSDICSFSL